MATKSEKRVVSGSAASPPLTTPPPPPAGIVIPTSQPKEPAGASEDQKERDKAWMRKYGFSADQLQELKESFALFDKAGEDMIGAGEVATALRAMGQNPTEAECCQMLGEVDLNEQGRVSLDEFLRVVSLKGLKNEPEMEEDLEEALRVFDKDGTGLIEAEELKTVLKTLGERLEEEDVNDLLKTADVDKDGRINYQDFVQKIVGK